MPGAEGQAAVPVLVDGLPDKTDTSGVYEQYKGYWGEFGENLQGCSYGHFADCDIYLHQHKWDTMWRMLRVSRIHISADELSCRSDYLLSIHNSQSMAKDPVGCRKRLLRSACRWSSCSSCSGRRSKCRWCKCCCIIARSIPCDFSVCSVFHHV